MKSSEGVHFLGLDHIRAFAVFIVVIYHFLGATNGGVHAASGSFVGNALFSEGTTGVGMFMTLSGYLMVRLARGRHVDFAAFLYNRALRLFPLLITMLTIWFVAFAYVNPGEIGTALSDLLNGLIMPSWPNGAWSITTEFQFYFLFPTMLVILRKNPLYLLLFPLSAIALRTGIFLVWGGQHLQDVAYWTIIGRIDQFALGMLFARYSGWFAGRHFLAWATAIVWILTWYSYAQTGGFADITHQWIWIGLTTVEGLAYAILVAYYDRSFAMSPTGISGAIAKVGEWSFGIYLLHSLFVANSAHWFDRHVFRINNFYLAFLFGIAEFLVAVAVARLSYRCIEEPFLRFRTAYFRRESGTCVKTPPLVSSEVGCAL
jgi:peptidoglycan/LPS O-acetylase OafA/YrhL